MLLEQTLASFLIMEIDIARTKSSRDYSSKENKEEIGLSPMTKVPILSEN